YRGCWHEVSRCLFFGYRQNSRLLTESFSFPTKELYNPKAFFTHAAWLDQACAHCPIFPTAASRRSLDRVSVAFWLIILSDQLRSVALVGLYPASGSIRRGFIPSLQSRMLPALPQIAHEELSYVYYISTLLSYRL